MVKTVTTPEQVLVVPVIKTSIMPGTAYDSTQLRDPHVDLAYANVTTSILQGRWAVLPCVTPNS